MAGAGLAAAAAGGGCTPTINVSSCIDVSGVLPQVDFYLNTLAGLPAGSRYDVLFVDEIGGLAVVKKGILDHAGHYGPWAVNDGLWAYCAVVVSDPLGGVVYYVAFSPWGHV
jgi:hypothetical protein